MAITKGYEIIHEKSLKQCDNSWTISKSCDIQGISPEAILQHINALFFGCRKISIADTSFFTTSHDPSIQASTGRGKRL